MAPPPPPAYPFPIPPEEEEEVVLSSLQRLSIDQEEKQYGAANPMLRFPSTISHVFTNGSTIFSDYMNGLGSSSFGASSFHNYPSFPNGSTMSSNHMNGLGSSSFGASSSHNYPSLPNGSTMSSNHMNGLGSSSFVASSSHNYPSFEHSISTLPNMGSTQGFLENSYVSSYHPKYFQNSDVSEPYFSLRMQGWTDDDIRKIVIDDPSLLDEVNSDDIIRMGGHKLGCKYLLKFLSNEGEKTRLIRLIGSTDLFKALVYVVANEVNTRLGSRAMQSLIKLLKECPLLIEYVLLVLKPNLLSVMLNKNGSQVTQKLLQLCKYGGNYKPLEHIYEIAVNDCLELATTEQGVFSLKAVIESIEGPLKIQLLSTICRAARFLSGHPYGNFVVQHVLKCHPNTVNLICDVLIGRGNLFMLSKDKYGSHVVESCIRSNTIDVVVLQLVSDSKQLVELAHDKFGNYVVQKALKETKGKPASKRLIDILGNCLCELETRPYGRNVYNLVKKMSPNLTRN